MGDSYLFVGNSSRQQNYAWSKQSNQCLHLSLFNHSSGTCIKGTASTPRLRWKKTSSFILHHFILMTMVERKVANRCDLAIIDTRNFERPVAIVQLPFHVKAQVHGNWVPASTLKSSNSLVRQVEDVKVSGRGALEPL